MELLLTDHSSVYGHLYKPLFLNSQTNSVFLHSRKRLNSSYGHLFPVPRVSRAHERFHCSSV